MRSLVFLLCLPALFGQTSDPWSALRAKNPSGIEVSMRLLREGSYRAGELIRAEVHYPDQRPVPAPPDEIWPQNGFLLDPPTECGTLAAPCFPFVPGGIVSGPGSWSQSPVVTLNHYLRSLAPGHYRAAALLRKQVRINREGISSSFGYADPPQYAVSNTVEFNVTAAPPQWIAQTIASSVAILKGPAPNSPAAWDANRLAAEQLRFLDSPAAWRAALDVMPEQENILLEGLSASREPAKVCELMEGAVASPGQAVSFYYLDHLGRLCTTAHMPAPTANPPEAERNRYWKQWGDYRESVMTKASAALAASLTSRQPAKQAIALLTLMQRVQQLPALPAWVPTLRSAFAASFAGMDKFQQRQLLSMYVNTLPSRDAIPLLETVLDGWKLGDYYEAPREALAGLHALDPARAQARIVAELKKDRTWLDAPQLAYLPPEAAHISDDALIASLTAAQRPGGWNVQLSMAALAKYASLKALPRVKAIYESQQDSCQPELLAYFVRGDPAYADRVFHSHPWDMQSEPPACTVQYFSRTPRIAMGPVLEKYMTAYLMHRTVRVKQTAAQALGQYGSPSALGPLRDTLRYFHDYWQGKAADLIQNNEGVGLERELRNAIARGRHWLATDVDLRKLEALCVSGQCVQETRQDLDRWKRPLRIELRGQGNASVAQYYQFESLRDVEQKLGQFPRGTQFALNSGVRTETDAAEIRKFAAAHGLTIVP